MKQTEKVLEGSVQSHWWVQAPFNRDVYEVYVVRYHERSQLPDGDYIGRWQEYLHDRRWHVYGEGEEIRPCLELDGQMIHTLAGVEMLPRTQIADALRDLAVEIVTKVIVQTVDAEGEG
jgi:hypothetical protein